MEAVTLPISVRIRDVMDKNVVLIDSREMVFTAIERMLEHKVWSVVVVKEGLPVGVVTERDVLRRCVGMGLDARLVEVAEIMTSPLLTISADASIGEAMHEMVRKDVRRLYIVEKGKLLGRVTQTAIFENLFGSMGALLSVAY